MLRQWASDSVSRGLPYQPSGNFFAPRPRSMKLGIHKKILQRLLIGWLLISLVLGGAVFYAELRWIDQRVLDLALEESAFFAASDPASFAQPEGEYVRTLTQKSEELVQRHFVVVELYNADKQLFVQTVRPGRWEVETRLSRHLHQFPVAGDPRFSTFYIDEQLLLQVLVPLKDATGKIFGYFEGVYLVESETLQHLRRDMARVL